MKDIYKKINWPKSDFTHTDLAMFNNKTNGQVWSLYDQAGKDGTIVQVGERKPAKGRASKVWRLADLNDGTDGVIPTSLIPTTPVAAPTPAPKKKKDKVKPAAVVPTVTVTEPVVPVAVPTDSQPAVVADSVVVVELAPVAPAAEAVVEPVVVTPVVKVPEVDTLRPVTVAAVCSNVETTEFQCPFCKTALLSVASGAGVRVWCPVNDLNVCKASENPYGFSNNVKNAYEILCQKYSHV